MLTAKNPLRHDLNHAVRFCLLHTSNISIVSVMKWLCS